MKTTFAFSLITLALLLAACQPAPTPTPSTDVASQRLSPTATPIPATATLAPSPTPAATQTPAPTVTPSPSITIALKPSLSVQIILDSSMMKQRNNASSAWLIYGIARNKWVSDHFLDLSSYKYSFAEELDAREALIKVWTELNDALPREQDTYLDELAIIYKAGYLREYVWTFFHYEDPAPPDGLRLPSFTPWMAQTLPQHRLQTLATIQIK